MKEYDEISKQIDQDGNIIEVAIVKHFAMYEFVIDIEANKTVPYQINENSIKFPNDFLITDILTQAETNSLAGFLLKLDGSLLPNLSWYIDASTKAKTVPLGVNTRGFACNTNMKRFPNLAIKIKQDDTLNFYVYNSHTSAQEIHVILLGYRIFEQVLNPKS